MDNCSFDIRGSRAWKVFGQSGAAATGDYSNQELRVNITNAGTETYHVQALTEILLRSAGDYRLTFKARAGAAKTLEVNVGHNGDDDGNYESYARETVSLTRSEKTFSLTLRNLPADAKARLEFNLGKAGRAFVILDEIALVPVSSFNSCGSVAGNLVDNCSFDIKSSRAWKVFGQGSGAATGDYSQANLRVNITNAGTETYHVQALTHININRAGTYKLSFKARAGAARTIEVNVGHNGDEDGNYESYARETLSLSRNQQNYTVTLRNLPADATARLEFNLGKAGRAFVVLDEIVLVRSGGASAMAAMADSNPIPVLPPLLLDTGAPPKTLIHTLEPVQIEPPSAFAPAHTVEGAQR